MSKRSKLSLLIEKRFIIFKIKWIQGQCRHFCYRCKFGECCECHYRK